MLLLPVLVGGLVVALNETCGHGSLLLHASRAFHGLSVTRLVDVDSATCSRGLLPVLAAQSIPHSAVVHEVGDGVTWAKRVHGASWRVPCLLVGNSRRECDAARFEEKLRVWCAVNDFIASSPGPYERRGGGKPTNIALPDDLVKCLDRFAHT